MTGDEMYAEKSGMFTPHFGLLFEIIPEQAMRHYHPLAKGRCGQMGTDRSCIVHLLLTLLWDKWSSFSAENRFFDFQYSSFFHSAVTDAEQRTAQKNKKEKPVVL